MYEVICPQCGDARQVKAKKTWMVGPSPYQKICKKCCQTGKEKSDSHKAKLAESARMAQSEELLAKKSAVQKELYNQGKSNIRAGAGAGWNKDLELPARSEETKKKISEGVRRTKGSHS